MCWIFKTLDFGLFLHRCTLVKREWLLAAKSSCTDWSRYGRRGKRKGVVLLDLLQVLGPHVSDTHRGDMTQLCYQAPEKPKRKPTDTFLTVMKHHETSWNIMKPHVIFKAMVSTRLSFVCWNCACQSLSIAWLLCRLQSNRGWDFDAHPGLPNFPSFAIKLDQTDYKVTSNAWYWWQHTESVHRLLKIETYICFILLYFFELLVDISSNM